MKVIFDKLPGLSSTNKETQRKSAVIYGLLLFFWLIAIGVIVLNITREYKNRKETLPESTTSNGKTKSKNIEKEKILTDKIEAAGDLLTSAPEPVKKIDIDKQKSISALTNRMKLKFPIQNISTGSTTIEKEDKFAFNNLALQTQKPEPSNIKLKSAARYEPEKEPTEKKSIKLTGSEKKIKHTERKPKKKIKKVKKVHSTRKIKSKPLNKKMDSGIKLHNVGKTGSGIPTELNNKTNKEQYSLNKDNIIQKKEKKIDKKLKSKEPRILKLMRYKELDYKR